LTQTFANLAETSSSEDIDDTTTTIPVEDRTEFSQSGEFGLLVQASDSEQNRELMTVTGGHGTGPGSFTVVRGPAPVPHAANSYVAQVLTASALDVFPQSAMAELSSAQLLDLHNTPVEVVGAPGAGKIVIVLSLAAVSAFGTTSYLTSNYLGLYYATSITGSARLFGISSLVLLNAFDTLFSTTPDTPFLAVSDAENQPIVLGVNDLSVGGPIITASVQTGGSGYAPGDTFMILDTNYDGFGTVSTVDGGGAVTDFAFASSADRGSAYLTSNNPIATSKTTGVGDDALTINVTTVANHPMLGDGTLRVTTTYQIIDI
jgi:hypothetical protein